MGMQRFALEAEWGIHGGGVGAKDALHEYGGEEELEEEKVQNEG